MLYRDCQQTLGWRNRTAEQEQPATCRGWQNGMPSGASARGANRRTPMTRRHRVVKRIIFGRDARRPEPVSVLLEYSQHLAKSVNRRGKEHHPKRLTTASKVSAGNGRRFGGDDFQIVLREPNGLSLAERRPPSRGRIDPVLALEPQGSYRQSGLSGPGRNVQNCVPACESTVLDESLRDRRKHLRMMSRCFSQNGAEAATRL